MVAVNTLFGSLSIVLLKSAFISKTGQSTTVSMSRNDNNDHLQPHVTMFTTILNS
jgi:hypothetical protein